MLNHDAIPKVASLDYLAMQTIGILDKPEALNKNIASIQALQSMGVKVVLATGISEQAARKIGLETGILRPEHERVCGAVISGKDLQKIFDGQATSLNYDITPEYLSVVYGATKQNRETLIDYLSKSHPGRTGVMNENSFGSENFLRSRHVATVGAIGSGENDV